MSYSEFSTPGASGASTPVWHLGEAANPHALSERLSRTVETGRHWWHEEAESRKNTIGGIDNLWLLLSDLTDFAPTCLSTYTLKGRLTKDELAKAISLQADHFPRYREKLVDRGRRLHGARFVKDPNFQVEHHIRIIHLPGNAGKTELDQAVSRFFGEEWDYSKPLWECLLVENYSDDSGATCALITRAHHTMADGQGFVLSQLWITSFRPELEKMMNGGAKKLDAAAHGTIRPSQISKALKPLDRFQKNALTAPILQMLIFSLFWSSQIFAFFDGLLWSIIHLVHATIMYTIVSWRTEYVTAPYRGTRVHGKEFSSSKTFPISDVKLVQKAFSGLEPGHWATKLRGKKTTVADKLYHITLNDVVCACMADVLGEEVTHVKPAAGLWPQFKYHLNRSFRPPIGLFIPISLRKPGQWDFRNPGKPEPQDLYKHIHRAKNELNIVKKSLLPSLAFHGVQNAASQAPALWPWPGATLPGPFRTYITEPFFYSVMSAFTGILTNVPGPAKEPVSLCGCEVTRWTALPPQGEKHTLGIGIMTYAGKLSISIVADDVRESRGVAKRICERFEKRFEEYVEVAREVLGKTLRNGYH